MIQNGTEYAQILETLLASLGRYRAGELTLAQLQEYLSAIAMAMESNVLRDVRDAISQADNQIELIRFTVAERDQPQETERALRELEAVILAWQH